MTNATTRSGLGAPALVAVAAVAIAGFSLVSDADTWAAYAQSGQPVTVKVGAMLAPADGSEFRDDYRQAAIEYAVAEFNRTNSGVKLDLTVYPYVRNETVNADENRTLIEAYAGGNGPRFYVGPTTSQGLENLRGNSTTRGYLDNDNVLLITPSSEAPQLALPDDNIFRLAFNVERQGTILVDEMKSDNIMSYVTVARNDAWGTELAEHVNERATQAGMTQRGDTILFEHNMTAAYWEGIRNMVNASVGTVPDGTRVGVFFLGYDNAYPNMSSAANSSDALRGGTAWYVPSTTINARLTIAEGTLRDFSAAVNLTALSQDVESNSVTMAIDLLVNRDAEFYDYAAYDSVFVLGNAMRMAMEAGENASDVATVEKYMAHAAMNYDGAALGNSLLLDGNGDLLAPDKFTVHTATANGNWDDGGESSSTVTRIGALVALGSTDYPDDKAWEAMREAAADYNADAQESLVKLIAYDITDPSDSDGYVAARALERAYAGGNGTSVYVGPSLSSNVEAVLPYATANNILLLGYASESESLSEPDDNLFRTAITTGRQGHFMAQVMADADVSSVVTVIRDDAWGRSLNSSIAEALAANDLQSAGVVTFAPGSAASAVGDIAAAIAGSSDAGVAFIATRSEQDALAAAAPGNATLTTVPWFVTPSGYYTDMSQATRDFAKAVNMTAIVLDVEDNAKKSALDARVSGLDFYGYSAYDGVHVLGGAIASVVESGKTGGINATDLRGEMHAAADAYEGILGDIALNTNGDLRSPDRFAVWQVDGSTGNWMDTGVTKQTPVVNIGALMAIDNTVYDDNKAWEALQRAAFDYNGAGERSAYLDVALYDITDPANSTQYVAASVLERAYDSGSGPSVYVGPSLSSNVRAVYDYVQDNDILLLGYASEAESLSTPDDNLFRTAITAGKHGHFMARVMADAEVDSVVTVVRDDEWGRSVNSSIAEALGANGLELAGTVKFAPGGAASSIGEISAAISASSGSGTTGVAFVGVEREQNAIAEAPNNGTVRGTQWFVTPSGFNDSITPTTNRDMSDFARAVNMTAIVLDVEDNAKKSALDARVPGLDFYGYSAYDALFVLGDAIASVVESGKTGGINATDLNAKIPLAAEAYKGVLGNIALNTNGDLRSPDRFAVWQVNSSGTWADTGARKQTPIVEVGALMAIDSTDYADNKAWEALRQAAVDYNGAGERNYYLNPVLYDITDPSDSGMYVAAAVLERAYAGGDGPNVYVGPSLSSNVEAVLDYAEANDITLLGFASESESLAVADDNLFRTAISTARHGHFMAQVMADAGVRSVVTVIRDDAWGRSMNTSIAEALAPNGLRSAGVVTYTPGSAASAIGDISAAISKSSKAGVAFVGVRADQDAVATAATGNATLTDVPWIVTPSGYYTDMSTTTRDFAKAVNMRAIVLDVEDNAKKSALDARVPSLDFYSYSAYDSLFVIGNAVTSAASEASKNTSDVTAAELQDAIPRAADTYEGVLGDIALNSKGDLRTPDRFAVWKVDSSTGMWVDTGVRKQTPVVDIGALIIREGDRFDDTPRFEAMRIAVNEYNLDAEDGGALYLNLKEVRTSLSPSSATVAAPDALTAVRAASSGVDGIRYFIGPSTSGNSGRVLEFANANNLTLISPSSTAPSLAIGDDALFRLVPNDSKQGKVLADIVHNHQGAILASLINETGHEHVIMVVRNDTWGQGLDGSTSERLGIHDVDITRVFHNEDDADWSKTAMDISDEIARVRASAPGDPIAVLHIGFPGDFLSLAAQAESYPSIRNVPWFGTDGVAGAAQLIDNGTASQFADDVSLTATKFDVVNNTKLDSLTSALQSRGIQVRTVYEYSAYDSVFVMASAIESAISAKGASSYTPADVRSMVRAAASGYDGALGDIELNPAGDLRSPNSYAAWTVENGAWAKVGETYPSTPVFDIGALLMLDNNPSYTDDDEKTALDLAVDDFNTEHELIGDFYIRMAVQRISISPTDTASPDPDALAGLKNAYANGSGPSYYVGPSTSGNTERILNYSNDNEIVILSHSSTAPKLAIPDDYVFRMTVPDSLQGRVLANLIGQEGSITDLVIVVRNDVWGQGVEESTKSSLESAGSGTAVTRVMFPPAEADWGQVARDLAGKIAAAKTSADAKTDGRVAVLFAGFPGDFNAVVSRSSSDMQLGGVAWFGADGVGNSNEVTSNSTAVEFAKSVNLTTVVYTAQPNDINRRINPAAVYGPSAYDAVYVLGNAMKAAYGDDRMPPASSAVKDALPGAARAYTGALGNVSLDANGDLASPISYGIHNIDAATDMWSPIRGMVYTDQWQVYDIDAGTGAWSLSTADIPLCGITLDNDEEPISMGNVNVGATSADVRLTIMRGGSAPVSSVNITATPWTATSGATSGATVLGPGATKVVTDAANPAGNPLSSPVIITDLGAEKVIVLRLDTAGASPTATVEIQQIVMYTATCGSP